MNQSSITWTTGRNSSGSLSRIMICDCDTSSHHCQLLWYPVGNAAKAGCLGSQRMPRVCGGCRFVQAVFQKMLEKPGGMGPCSSPRTVPGRGRIITLPPDSSRASA